MHIYGYTTKKIFRTGISLSLNVFSNIISGEENTYFGVTSGTIVVLWLWYLSWNGVGISRVSFADEIVLSAAMVPFPIHIEAVLLVDNYINGRTS